MEDSRKKFRECPLAVLACMVKPHRVSPHIVEGPSGQLEIFSNVSKCCCTAAPPLGLSSHDCWERKICLNEKPRLKCDGRTAPRGIEYMASAGRMGSELIPELGRCEQMETGGPSQLAPLFLVSWGHWGAGSEQEGPSISSL